MNRMAQYMTFSDGCFSTQDNVLETHWGMQAVDSLEFLWSDIQFTHSVSVKHSGCFQFGTTRNKDTSRWVYLFVWTLTFISVR